MEGIMFFWHNPKTKVDEPKLLTPQANSQLIELVNRHLIFVEINLKIKDW
jgi:hypothetical protein